MQSPRSLRTDPPFHLHIRSEPEDVVDVLNKGFRRSSGEICGYLNCDGQYLMGSLESVASFFQSHPDVDIVFGDVLLVGMGGEALCYRRGVAPMAMHTRIVNLGNLACAMIFWRRVLEVGLWFDPASRDIVIGKWVFRAMQAGCKVAAHPVLWGVLRFTNENLPERDRKLGSEQAAWAREAPVWQRALHVPLRLLMAWWKLRAGAFRSRAVNYAVYLPRHCHRRYAFHY